MPTLRNAYRTLLENKLRDVADSLGKKDFSDTEKNEMLDNAPRRLFPNVYKITQVIAQSSDSNGRMSTGSVDANRVFEIWDDDFDELVTGWKPRGVDTIVGLPSSETNLRFYHLAPYTMPADDVTDPGIPDEYKEMVVLAAALDGLERLGVDKVDFTGYQPNSETGVDENEILNLYSALSAALAAEIDLKGMSLPALAV
jgi:hypothetical protein